MRIIHIFYSKAKYFLQVIFVSRLGFTRLVGRFILYSPSGSQMRKIILICCVIPSVSFPATRSGPLYWQQDNRQYLSQHSGIPTGHHLLKNLFIFISEISKSLCLSLNPGKNLSSIDTKNLALPKTKYPETKCTLSKLLHLTPVFSHCYCSLNIGPPKGHSHSLPTTKKNIDTKNPLCTAGL